MEGINIRRAREEDFEQVFNLLGQLWPDFRLDADSLKPRYVAGLASDDHYYLCATQADRVVGFGSLTFKADLWPEGQVALLDELVTDAACRGQGIGHLLVEHLTKTATDKGCCRIELVSAFSREESHKFYNRLGFESRAFVFWKPLVNG